MIFKHFTNELFNEFIDGKLFISWKPIGLWLSCNNNWIKWSKKEMFEIYKYEYKFNIDLKKILVLENYNDISEFTKKYKSIYKTKLYNTLVINWKKVSKDYSGIYIKNANIEKARKDFLWYNTVDVCSICIWNKDAIISFSKPKIL